MQLIESRNQDAGMNFCGYMFSQKNEEIQEKMRILEERKNSILNKVNTSVSENSCKEKILDLTSLRRKKIESYL